MPPPRQPRTVPGLGLGCGWGLEPAYRPSTRACLEPVLTSRAPFPWRILLAFWANPIKAPLLWGMCAEDLGPLSVSLSYHLAFRKQAAGPRCWHEGGLVVLFLAHQPCPCSCWRHGALWREGDEDLASACPLAHWLAPAGSQGPRMPLARSSQVCRLPWTPRGLLHSRLPPAGSSGAPRILRAAWCPRHC